jgi:predicted transcriptional regulator
MAKTLMESLNGSFLTPTVMKNMVNVFSALSDDAAIKIFFAAHEGIESSTRVIHELELTQKKYYNRLKDLINAGLIHKEDENYNITTSGELFFKLGELFAEIVNKSDHLNLIDKVKLSSSLSMPEKQKVIQVLSNEGLAEFMDLLNGGIKPVGIVTKFEDLKLLVTKLIEGTDKELYMASRYTDVAVVDTILKSINRGVKMHFLDGDKQNLNTKTQILRMILSNPLKLKKFYDLFSSPLIHIKFCNLPFSFLVADEKTAVFELVNPQNNEFISGLLLENVMLSKRLIEIFARLYANADEDPLKAFAKDLKI